MGHAASPYGEVLLQEDMDGTLQKKGYGEFRQIRKDLQKDMGGYILEWSDKKCALGADAIHSGNSAGDSSSSSANSFGASNSMGSAGARTFECLPSKVDHNGRREEGLPGTEHRRRWRINEDGADGKTGSCCGYLSCNSCEENFAIRNDQMQCGLGEYWLCASQHR